MPRPKDVLTTGEVARICNVAPRTVSKWFDSGKLRGYRIPGSKDRRIPLQQLIRFMRAHSIPLNGLDTGITRVLVAEGDPDIAELLSGALARDAGYEVRVARSAFEAGALAESLRPHAMFLDVTLPGLSGREAIRSIRNLPDLGACKLIALTGPLQDGEGEAIQHQGFDIALAKPFKVSEAIQAIEEALAVVY
ncbi:MAG: response regulator [Phycisphaerae bacterium]|nr:response regulator [Phycisphaerae bacterium]